MVRHGVSEWTVLFLTTTLVPSRSKKTGSILTKYLQEISESPLLTADEEQELATEIQLMGNLEAHQRMLRSNLRLVVSIAKKYSPGNDPDMLMDLIQEGNLGLMRAVDRFQPGRNTRFSTYGVYWIKQAILRALKARRTVRLPENVVDRLLKMQRTKQRLYQLLGRVPTPEEIAQEMEATLVEIRRLEAAAAEVVSLDQTSRGADQSESSSLGDLLADVEAPQPDDVAITELMRVEIQREVATLPAREQQILALRFGLSGNKPHTLEDIGHEFGVSRERVRQLQNAALERLRKRRAIQRAYQ